MQNTHGRSEDVRFELDAAPCWVVASNDGLRRAVGNLLDNARKWSPPGETVSVECRGGTVVVHDHGPGIADADLPHIFDRFYRSSAARGLPGSGLGLAIVAQVVKAEGGTIVAENDPRGGARMTMRLPTIAGPDQPEPTRARRGGRDGRRAGPGFLRGFLTSTNLRPRCGAETGFAASPAAEIPPPALDVESPPAAGVAGGDGPPPSLPASPPSPAVFPWPSSPGTFQRAAMVQSPAISSIRLPNGSST